MVLSIFSAIINYFFAFFPDELRPPSKDLPELLPTVHPNSVLPYHPEDLDYEDYVYEEYEDEKDEVTKSYVKVLITNFYIKADISLKIGQLNTLIIL